MKANPRAVVSDYYETLVELSASAGPAYFTRQSFEPSLTGFFPERSPRSGMLSMGLNRRCFS